MAIINNTWSIEHFQLTYKTKEQWEGEYKDYILAAGEPAVEIDTGKTKLGDGVKKWSELEYYSDPVLNGLITALTERLSSTEVDITAIKGRLDTAESNIETLQSKVEAIENITTISVNPLVANGD